MIPSPSAPSRKRALASTLVFVVAAGLALAAPLSAAAVNSPPSPLIDTATTAAGTAPVTLYWADLIGNDIDIDGDVLSLSAYSLVTMNAGTIMDLPGVGFEYTPAAGFTGIAKLKYTVEDPAGASKDSEIQIEVTPAGTPLPIARPDSYTTAEGTALSVDAASGVLKNDSYATLFLGFDIRKKPAHGTVVDWQENGSFVYLPDAGYVGKDSFQYRDYVDANFYISNYATVTIDVKGVANVAGLVVDKIVGGAAGKQGSVTVTSTSDNSYKAGAPVYVYVDGQKLGTGLTDANGAATIAFTLPQKAGTFALKIVSGTQSITKTITITPGAPAVSSIALTLPAGKPGQTVYLVSKITSSNPFRAGTSVTAYLDGKKVTSRVTDATGTAKIPLKLPALAGRHDIRIVAGSKSAVKNFTYGKGVTAKLAKLAKLKTVTAKKTETIKGSFGTKAGKITIKVTDPKGKTTTKTVTLSSKGKFSYKYKTGATGKYKVTYSYRASTKYYGAKTYTASFRAK